jgi:hypothetical protein
MPNLEPRRYQAAPAWELAFLPSATCCLWGGRGDRRDPEVVEEGLHADAEGFVVAVDDGPVRGFASAAGAADAGEDRGDDLVAEGEQGSDGAETWDSPSDRTPKIIKADTGMSDPNVSMNAGEV